MFNLSLYDVDLYVKMLKDGDWDFVLELRHSIPQVIAHAFGGSGATKADLKESLKGECEQLRYMVKRYKTQ